MTTLGGLLYGMRPATITAGGVMAGMSFDHAACEMSAFCRNPLHPGPCKGWKKTLGKIAPGALQAIEKTRAEKTAAKRAARAVAKSAAEQKVATGPGRDLAHPLTAKKKTLTHANVLMGDDAAKAKAKADKAILNKTEIKKYSQLKAAQIAGIAGDRGLNSDPEKYRKYLTGAIAQALANDNVDGGDRHYRLALDNLSDALASPLADRYCGTGTKDGDCDGLLYEALHARSAQELNRALTTGNPDGLNKLEADLKKIGDDREAMKKYLTDAGVDMDKIKSTLYEPDDEPSPSKGKEKATPEEVAAAKKKAAFEKGEKTKMDNLVKTAEAQKKASGTADAVLLLASMTSGKKLTSSQEASLIKNIQDAHADGSILKFKPSALTGLAHVAGKTKTYTGVELNNQDKAKLESEFLDALEKGTPTPLLDAIKKSWGSQADEFGAPGANTAAIEAMKKAFGKTGPTPEAPTTKGAPGAAFVSKIAKQAGLKVDAAKAAKHQELISQKLADGDEDWFYTEAGKLADAVIAGHQNENGVKFFPDQAKKIKAALVAELAPGIKGQAPNTPVANDLDKGDTAAALLKVGADPVSITGPDVVPAGGLNANQQKAIDLHKTSTDDAEVLAAVGDLDPAEYDTLPAKAKSDIAFFLEVGMPGKEDEYQAVAEKLGVPGPYGMKKAAPPAKTTLQDAIDKGQVSNLTPEAVEASLVADKLKSATAKKKLEIYGALADKGGFDGMSPYIQVKLLNDLDAMYDKFQDPKKKAETSTTISKLQAQLGGGAGAGGKLNSTNPAPVPGVTPPVATPPLTNEERGKLGAALLGEDLKLVGNTKWTSDGEKATAQVITKLLENKQDATLEKVAQTYAETYLHEGGIAPTSQVAGYVDPLAADLLEKLKASGAPTPVYDAWKSAQKAKGGPAAHAELIKFDQMALDWHAKNSTGGPATVPKSPPTTPELTKTYSDSFDSLRGWATGGTSKPGSGLKMISDTLTNEGEAGFTNPDTGLAKTLGFGLGSMHSKTVAEDLDLTDAASVAEWKNNGFADKLLDTLGKDYHAALLAGKPAPEGLAGEIDVITADVMDKAEALAKANGWAADVPAIKSWKKVYFQSQVDDWLKKNTTTPTPTVAPSSVPGPPHTGGTLWEIDKPAQHILFSAYKTMPKGTVLSASAEDQFDNIQAVAAFYAGKADMGFPAVLSIAQVTEAADAALAQSMGVPNQGLLTTKLKDWLATSQGMAYAKSHPPDPALLAKLDGGGADEANKIVLKPGQKVQDVPGPGGYKKSLTSAAFKTLSSEEMTASQEAYFQASGEWWTPEQIEALGNYTTGSYHDLNGYLRGKDASGYPVTSISNLGAQRIKQIQAAMRPLQQHTLLKRGTGWEFLPDEYRSAEGARKLIGKSFQDKGFVSTTIGDIPSTFDGSVNLIIEAPKGTPAAFVQNISYHDYEKEAVLAAGTKFKILSVDEDGYGKTIITVRVVS